MHLAGLGIDDDAITGAGGVGHVLDPADERDSEGAGDNGDMGRLSGFLDKEPRNAIAAVVQELRRSHRARNDDSFVGQSVGLDVVRLDEMAQEPACQIVEIVQAAAEIGIIGAVDARARFVLNALDGGLGGQTGANGVAQALAPAEVRIAARGIGSWINAQGDAAGGADTDATSPGANSRMRIDQVQAHYAETCAQFRRG